MLPGRGRMPPSEGGHITLQGGARGRTPLGGGGEGRRCVAEKAVERWGGKNTLKDRVEWCRGWENATKG